LLTLNILNQTAGQQEEFINRNLDDNAFIDIAYLTILNRIADQAGKDYWLSQLAGGLSRLGLINEFVASQEFSELAEEYDIHL